MAMAKAGSKTPVSVLQEYLVTKNCTPKYNDISVTDRPGTNDKIFVVGVFVLDLYAEGEGRSKQQAKHQAASKMIELLQINDPEVAEVMNEVVTPSAGDLEYNAVGQLSELCTEKAIPEPCYNLISTEGPPHARLFTYECAVGSHISEKATCSTKKLAKRTAAYQMLKRLLSMQGENIEALVPVQNANNKSTKRGRTDEEVTEVYMKASRYRVGAVKSPYIADQHHNFRGLMQESPQLKELLKADPKDVPNILPLLKEVADELNVQLKCYDLQEYGVKSITLTTIPSVTDIGDTYESAAWAMVDALKIFQDEFED